jgi:D-alanyl-D-alanine carboxypeptidase (penicillin-binding protein 5/6)
MSRLAAFLFALIVCISPAHSAERKSAAKTRRSTPPPSRTFTVPDANDPSVFPGTSAQSALLCDAVTGRVLYEKNADEPRGVASTQKLLTGLIIAEEGNLNGNVRAESADSACEQTKLGLRTGEIYKRYDLLRLMLVKSENDIARCLARDSAGSYDAFAEKMNAKAREIGMKRSHFVNPNGLTEPGQYSTARDMARLALHAYRNRVIRGIISTRALTWTTPAGKSFVYENTNKLLKSLGCCNGMKTGYTEAAGHCLVSSANEGGRHVICVVLGERHREDIWNDSFRMLNWGLYQMKTQPAGN